MCWTSFQLKSRAKKAYVLHLTAYHNKKYNLRHEMQKNHVIYAHTSMRKIGEVGAERFLKAISHAAFF